MKEKHGFRELPRNLRDEQVYYRGREMKTPLNRIEAGIELCLKNSSQFCSDVEMIVKPSFEHALGLCILALEELGKAMMLREMAD